MPSRREEPGVKPIDAETFPGAAEFALKAAGLDPGNIGIGIFLPEDAEKFMPAVDYACERFRYAALYSDDGEAVEGAAERIYAELGLPLMTYGAEDFSKCRYPLLMDFARGRLRLGRDLCIIGTDENGGFARG